ncbi:ribosomal protein L54 [Pseudoscourfieldia marina]
MAAMSVFSSPLLYRSYRCFSLSLFRFSGGVSSSSSSSLISHASLPPLNNSGLLSFAFGSNTRAYGKQAAGGGKATKNPQVPGKTRVDVVAGTNILKSGGEDVKIMEDEAYPEWLYKIAEPQPSLTDLRAIVGNGEGLFELDGPGRARYLRLERRDRIKSNNKRSSK